jgi:hypothetical protein
MITIKTGQVLRSFKGEPLKQGTDDLTVGYAISQVLGGKVSNPTLGWALGKKFATDKEVELKAEEVVFIKDTLNASDTWLAIVTGQLLDMLDGTKEK